jgi:hypothetical protein
VGHFLLATSFEEDVQGLLLSADPREAPAPPEEQVISNAIWIFYFDVISNYNNDPNSHIQHVSTTELIDFS